MSESGRFSPSGRRIFQVLHPLEQRRQEQPGHNHCTDGVARKADDRLAVADPQDGGFSGPNGHAVNQDARFSQFVHDVRCKIACRDGGPRGNHQRVRRLQGRTRCGKKGGVIVFYDPLNLGNSPCAGHKAGDGIGVDIPDLAGAGCLLRWDNLVAGGDNRHMGSGRHLDVRDAQSHQSAEILGAEDMPRGEQRLSLLNIFADMNDVLPRRDSPQHFDRFSIELLRPFHHHNSVSPGWNHPACKDGSCLSRTDRQFGRMTHWDFANQGKICGQ
ncbi:MAG: hypothetical protein A4E72_01974 [Syntrophus sp. PtaU1.Bin208]|nr:MAG: hypothetical protein A4E72_01974 [Syntrophus sp. PtaU1.Bin208]